MGLGSKIQQFGHWFSEQAGWEVPDNVTRYVKKLEYDRLLTDQNAWNDAEVRRAAAIANQSTEAYVAELEMKKNDRDMKIKIAIAFAIIFLVMIIIKVNKS